MKDFRRDAGSAHIKRPDGAWIHFTVTVAWDGTREMSLFAYNFEVVFGSPSTPQFVRFDLNEPGHASEARELRSHMHPGSDDLLVPAPVMTPQELVGLFLDGMSFRNPAKPRR